VSRLKCSDGCVVYSPGLDEGLPLFDCWQETPESRLELKGGSQNGVKLKTTIDKGGAAAVCKREGSAILFFQA
jgi:hypothetical protein